MVPKTRMKKKLRGRTFPVHWISLDLDWITGDCISRDSNSKVPRCGLNCGDCISRHYATNEPRRGVPRYDELTMQTRWEKIEAFLAQFKFPRAVVRDSHAEIWQFIAPQDVVYNIDTHHDCYSPYRAAVECGNWGNHIKREGAILFQYDPPELPPVARFEGKTVYLFICLSRPYTSNHADVYLGRILANLHCKVDYDLQWRK